MRVLSTLLVVATLVVLLTPTVASAQAMPPAGEVNSMLVTAAELEDTANFLTAARAAGQGCNGAIEWPPGSGRVKPVRGAASATAPDWTRADGIWSATQRWITSQPSGSGQGCGSFGNKPVNWGGYATVCPDPIPVTVEQMRADASSMRMMVAAYACHLNGDLAAQERALQQREADRQQAQEAELQRQRLQEQERRRLAAQQQAASGAPAPSDTPPPPHSSGNAGHGTPALDAAESRDQQAQANQAAMQSYADNTTRAASQVVGIRYSGQRSVQIQIMLSPETEFLWVGPDGGNGLSTRINVDVPYWFSDCKDKVCQGVDFRLGGHFGIG